MALLDSHLEQMTASAAAIGALEFAPPGIFTNAVLGSHEITALIRDTEPHERSLFTLDPSVARATTRPGRGRAALRPAAQQQSAVARVLGPELLSDIRRSARDRRRASAHGGVDVEVLLNGAEKLCQAYPVAGVPERIRAIRERHRRIAASVQEYEDKVLRQQSKLSRLHLAGEGEEASVSTEATPPPPTAAARPPPDMDALEAEVAELEARKRLLEERVAGMEKDLGGLLQEES